MTLPETYVIQKFYQYAGYPRHKKISNVYEAGCPMCREGNSWGRKRRLYYLTRDSVICCHNCGWYSSPVKWIMKMSGQGFHEIVDEVKAEEYDVQIINDISTDTIQPPSVSVLPHDSINLFDGMQVEYYKDHPVVQCALRYVASRRLNSAVAKPSALYVSLSDRIHKNRLCIPFYDRSGNVIHYQTRTIMEDTPIDVPKYLSKLGSDRSVFGIDRVSDIYSSLYLFEGPIDACFVENGLAIAGIQESSESTLTPHQEDMLSSFYFLRKIWILDNQRNDTASLKKTKKLISQNEHVFIWPKSLDKYKDFNEMCVQHGLDEIDHRFIDKHVFSGREAQLRLI